MRITDAWAQISALIHTCCENLSKLFNSLESQFPHLYNLSQKSAMRIKWDKVCKVISAVLLFNEYGNKWLATWDEILGAQLAMCMILGKTKVFLKFGFSYLLNEES